MTTIRPFRLDAIEPGDQQVWTFHPDGGVYLDAYANGVCHYIPVNAREVHQLLTDVDQHTVLAFRGGAHDVRVTHGFPPTVELRGARDTWHQLPDDAALSVVQYIARVVLAARAV